MRITSVRARLTLWNVLVLALILAVLGATLRYSVQANLLAAVDRELAGRARRPMMWWSHVTDEKGAFVERDIRDGPGRGGPEAERDRSASPQPPPLFRTRHLRLDGQDLFPGASLGPWDGRTFWLSARGGTEYSTIRVDNEVTRVYSVPLRKEGAIRGVLQIARSLAEMNQEVNRLTRNLLTLIPLGLLIAGIGGAFLTDRALRPVRRLARAAEQIEAESLSGRLPVTGGDEFADLARTFNGMLGRLEGAFTRLETAFEQQQRFTADASHELRTPLTVIKANSSLTLRGERTPAQYRQALLAIDRATDTTNRIVGDLLLLARSDADQLELRLRPLRIRDVLEDAVDALRSRERENAPVTLDVADPGLSVLGDAHHLVRLFANLLENAARHTPSEGRITLSAWAGGDSVVAEVRDTGEGIPPEHLPHVVERFYRVDAARARTEGGTGLGLAICRSIAEEHGGSLAITSVVGEGTNVRVTLPRALPAPEETPALAVSGAERG